jgi:hypothetical protein
MVCSAIHSQKQSNWIHQPTLQRPNHCYPGTAIYNWCTGWLKSHAIHVKIFINGCNSIKFLGLINTQYHCGYTRAHADHVMLQPAHLSVVFQQSKGKDIFFTSAMSIHCRTLPNISFLTCQNEFRVSFSWFSCAKQISNISSGKPFPWHR